MTRQAPPPGEPAAPMRPDDEACYRAIRARDARFDGWFYVGVTSTGIYCRPSCPSVTPKRENVTFHASAASAQGAGLRACKRCRPDAAPGSPAWNFRADVAGRALRLINDGLVDRVGVAGLAARLGYSARQLQRTLTAEVGAGASALARAQRAQTARILLETTPMPAGEVAFAAGFGSIRQFNDTLRTVYAASPSQLRAAAARRAPAMPVAETAREDAGGGASTTVPLRLAYRAPMDLGAALGFLRARAIPGVERADADGGYSALIRAPHGPVLVRVDPEPGRAPGAHPRDSQAPAVSCRLRLRDVRDLAFAAARLRALL
ncbi:MAG: helix-turn-helix domain-containing protein, partial [Frankiaceae bacterium]|nr:helix-turn-helix domain-containing protein [Frankiaceae bacterium]